MLVKIGYEHWHVECQCSSIMEFVKCAKRAFVEYAKTHGIPDKPMMLATWSGREWWSCPPDYYNAQKTGDVVASWPVEKNDFVKIWDALEVSIAHGEQFNAIVGFVASDTPEERRAKFKIVVHK
jgi:hypothetical protein